MTSVFERLEQDQPTHTGTRPRASLKQLGERLGGYRRDGEDYLVRAFPSGVEVWRYPAGGGDLLERVEVLAEEVRP